MFVHNLDPDLGDSITEEIANGLCLIQHVSRVAGKGFVLACKQSVLACKQSA